MYRQVTLDDLSQLIEMELKFFDKDSNLDKLEKAVINQTGFVYQVDVSIKAYILYTDTHVVLDMSCDPEKIGYIISLAVESGFQGQGISKQLMKLVPLTGKVALHVKKK